MSNVWRKCNICKNDIQFKSVYWECSVSTCNNKRTGLVFCTTACFERHLPGARHRDAAAVECKAPAGATTSSPAAAAPTRRIITSKPASSSQSSARGQAQTNEILVVVSKLKKYIQDRAGMNTAQNVMPALSNELRRLCDQAIENAERDGRKTVMDRDFR